jgi:hypothetical protein
LTRHVSSALTLGVDRECSAVSTIFAEQPLHAACTCSSAIGLTRCSSNPASLARSLSLGCP